MSSFRTRSSRVLRTCSRRRTRGKASVRRFPRRANGVSGARLIPCSLLLPTSSTFATTTTPLREAGEASSRSHNESLSLSRPFFYDIQNTSSHTRFNRTAGRPFPFLISGAYMFYINIYSTSTCPSPLGHYRLHTAPV